MTKKSDYLDINIMEKWVQEENPNLDFKTIKFDNFHHKFIVLKSMLNKKQIEKIKKLSKN